jgi:hypothetical protein
MSTLVKRAVEVYLELSKAREAEQAAQELASREQRIQAGKDYFKDIFKEEPPKVCEDGSILIEALSDEIGQAPPAEENPYHPYVGLAFGFSHGQHFILIGKCTRCGHHVPIGDVRSAYDLGYYLSNWEIPFHECEGRNSTYVHVTTPEEKLSDYMNACEALMDNGSSYDKVDALTRMAEAQALLLIAERLGGLHELLSCHFS